MTEIKNQSLQVFLEQLASKQATPGGGSVAALMGAQGAALISMVCHLTIDKPKYATVAIEMQSLLNEADALQASLTEMVKADIEVFNELMACYVLPKTTEDEKAYRNNEIQGVLKQATVVPLACAQACAKTLSLSAIAAKNGYKGVVSDAGVAAMAAYSGLKSAALNVYVNAGGIKDREFAEAKLAELALLLDNAEAELADIYQLVKERL